MTDTRFTPLSREELARARRAAAGTPSPQTGIPMGIRYKSTPTGRAPRPAAAKNTTLRPGWALTLTATPSAALTRLATATVPAARPHGIAVPRQQATPAPAAGPGVLRCTDAYACLRCGARYTRPNRHDCGRLTPVTVTVTARTSTPEPGALGSYDTFGCWTCQTTGPGNAGHPCGPLVPVTVTITVRTTTVPDVPGTGPRRRAAARQRQDPAVDDTIRQLHGQGLNDAQIAARTGLTRGQVHYIRGKRLALATQFGPRGHSKTSTSGSRP